MFAFRLPNVLSFILAAYYIWLSGNRLSLVPRWSLILGVLFCYPLYEYFGLARGYGLSFAFLIMHLYYLLQFQQNENIKHLWLCVFAICLGMSANLTLINEAVFTGLWLSFLIFRRPTLRFRAIGPLLFLIVITSLFAWLGFQQSDTIKLYFNKSDGFVDVTISSILNMMTYSHKNPWTLVVIIAPLVIPFLTLALNLQKSKGLLHRNNPFLLLSAALFANSCASILLSLVFDIHYPFERVALYYLILYFFAISFSAHESQEYPRWINWIKGCAIAAPSFFVALHFVLNFDLFKSDVEPYAHLPESTYLFILKDSQAENLKNPIISGDNRLTHAWRYYNFKHGSPLNPWVNETPLNFSDYTIVADGEIKKSKRFLPERTLTPQKRSWGNQPYIHVIKDAINSNSECLIELNDSLHLKVPSKTAIVISVLDKDRTEVFYHSSRLDQSLIQLDFEFHRSWIIPKCHNCTYEVYIQNINESMIR